MNNERKVLLFILGLILYCSSYAQDPEAVFQNGNLLSSYGKYAEALVYVDSSLRMDSSLYQRYSFRAELKSKLGMFESAINDISKCIERCKCPTRKYHVSDYFIERASLQFSNGNLDLAMADVNQSIEINPSNWRSYYFRSVLFMNEGNAQLALQDLDKSIQMNDNETTTLVARAKLRIELNDLSGACSDVKKLIEWGFDQFDPWVKENCKK